MKHLLIALLLVCSTSALADYLADGQRALNAGNYTQAVNDLDKYLDRNPNNAEALFSKGLALTMQGQDDAAIKVFAALARDYPELPEPYNNLAVLYARAGRYEEARDALEAALVNHPSFPTAHENLGDIYAALANAAYNRAIVLDKGNHAVKQKQVLAARLIDLEESKLPPTTVASDSQPAADSTPTKPAASSVTPPARPSATATPAAQGGSSTTATAIAAPAAPLSPPEQIAAATPDVSAPKSAVTAPAAPSQPSPVQQPVDSYDIPDTFSTEPVLRGGAATSSSNTNALPASDKQAVLDRVESWRAAWSAKDPDAYLENYSPNFEPATGVSRSTWESQRRTRVVRPRSIQIQVLDPKVSSNDANSAVVEFVQIYESNTYSDQVRKKLVMERVGSQWLIVQESVIG